MNQPASDNLFDLVHSMSRNEKRRFRMEARIGKETQSNYELLFDALNDLPYYDEGKLKKMILRRSSDKAKGQGVVGRLAREKCYLYDFLLDCLRKYNSGKFDYIRLKEMIIDARLLKERGLTKQADKIILRAKKLAKKYGNQLALLEINREERSLTWVARKDKPRKLLQVLVEEKEAALAKLKLELEYQEHYDDLYLLDTEKSLSDRQRTALKKKYLPLLDLNKIKELPLFAQLRLLMARSVLFILIGDIEGKYENSIAEYQWWQEKPLLQKDEFLRYYIMLGYYLYALNKKQKFDVVLNLIEQLEEKAKINSIEEYEVFKLVFNYKLLYYLRTIQLGKAKEMVPGLEKGLQNKLLPASTARVISFNIGTLYLLLEDFKRAGGWYYQASDGIKTGQKISNTRAARLLLCLTYYELEAFGEFDNLFRVIERYNKNEEPNDMRYFEKNILRLLKDIMNTPVLEEKKAHQKLKEFMDEYSKNPNRKRLFGFDEFYVWNESKLRKKPLAQTFEEIQAMLG